MPTPHFRAIALACVLASTGCSASMLGQLAGGAGTTTPKASSAPATSTAASPTPLATPSGGEETQAFAQADLEAVQAFQAKVEAASDDPEKEARLFVAAFARYKDNKELAIGLMMLAATDGERQVDPTKIAGYTYPAARSIYWAGVDRQPTLPYLYFDDEANATGPNAEDHVVIDNDYAAVDKGIQGKLATYYIKVSGDAGNRSRPLRLEQGELGWRVSNYSSLVVPI